MISRVISGVLPVTRWPATARKVPPLLPHNYSIETGLLNAFQHVDDLVADLFRDPAIPDRSPVPCRWDVSDRRAGRKVALSQLPSTPKTKAPLRRRRNSTAPHVAIVCDHLSPGHHVDGGSLADIFGDPQRHKMAALVRISPDLRAVLASHVAFSSWTGVVFGRRTMSRATVWLVWPPRQRTSR